MTTFICQECGKEYHPLTANQNKYCSSSCAFKHNNRMSKIRYKARTEPATTRVCPQCGKEFTAKRKYCSDKCRKAYYAAHYNEFYNHRKEDVFRECPICGKAFVSTALGRKRLYCSNECRAEAYRIKYNRTKQVLIENCLVCGKSITQPDNVRRGRMYCGYECKRYAHQLHHVLSTHPDRIAQIKEFTLKTMENYHA
jgi:endogenous inhibitor of DNA gyrase (YacG/DUF329 family)